MTTGGHGNEEIPNHFSSGLEPIKQRAVSPQSYARVNHTAHIANCFVRFKDSSDGETQHTDTYEKQNSSFLSALNVTGCPGRPQRRLQPGQGNSKPEL